MKVFISMPVTRDQKRTAENNKRHDAIISWLREHNIEHWKGYREDSNLYVVEFYGMDQEQDIIAFRLMFGL